MENFPQKSRLILGLISSTFDELCEPCWFNTSCLIGLGGGLYTRPGWKGTFGIKGLLFVIFPLTLFMEWIRSLLCTWCIFPVSIFVLQGIFCDRFDGWLIGWLMRSGFFLLNPALPWPVSGISIPPWFWNGMLLSGFRLGSEFFPMPWTSRSFIPLDLAWDLVGIKYSSIL